MMEKTVKTESQTSKKFLSALQGEVQTVPPFWFMRQAGRYLPEYRELRQKAGGFLDMVYNPEFAIEVTMQPLRRFDMDAAILFSDILVIPHALGQKLEFVAGEGPKLDAVRDLEALGKLSFSDSILDPVYDSVSGIRSAMGKEGFDEAALIGFAGAPWTVATYMVEGGGSKTFGHVKKWAYGDAAGFQKLIDLIADTTIHYLGRQIESGAEAIQIFDSWAGALDEQQFSRWVIQPTAKIVKSLKEKYPHIPLIGFPKGAGLLYRDYAAQTDIDVLGLDAQMPLGFAQELQKNVPVQGNLDPVCLLTGGDVLRENALRILEKLSGGPFVFNLGHGVIKETPPEHVQQLSEIIKGWQG